MNFWCTVVRIGSLRYWYERNKVDLSVSNTAVWNDDAVQKALDSAAFWVNGLPFVKSLSGYWKFFLASNPNAVPKNFYESAFQDSDWETLPGKICNFKSFISPALTLSWSYILYFCFCYFLLFVFSLVEGGGLYQFLASHPMPKSNPFPSPSLYCKLKKRRDMLFTEKRMTEIS